MTFDLMPARDVNIFTLVGLNETGKTTILEAINFFQEDIDQEYTAIPKIKNVSFEGNVSVTAVIELNEDDKENIKKYGKIIGLTSISSLPNIISITKSYIFSNGVFNRRNLVMNLNVFGTKAGVQGFHQVDKNSKEWSELNSYIINELTPKIIYYPHFLYEFPERIYLSGKKSGDNINKEYKKIVQDILSAIDPNFDVDKEIVEKVKKDDNPSRNSIKVLKLKMVNHIKTNIIKKWEGVFDKKTIDKEITVEFNMDTKSGGKTANPSVFMELGVASGDEPFHISELSLGFRWFFTFLLFTEYRKKRTEEKGETLFLVDEPASNLHSGAQKRLRDELYNIIEGSKLIYTTHSQYLINPEWLEGAHIVSNTAVNLTSSNISSDQFKTDIKLETYRKFVSSNPDQTSQFQPILDALDYKPSDLEMVPEIVIVEGKNDFYTYKYILNRNIIDFDLNLYPGNGADGNYEVIRLYLAWGRNFIMILDSDKKGLESQKAYKKEFGLLVENRIFTLKDVSPKFENYASESFFNPSEKKELLALSKYQGKISEKNRLNLVIQTLLFHNEDFKITAKTLNEFKLVFKFMNDKIHLNKVGT